MFSALRSTVKTSSIGLHQPRYELAFLSGQLGSGFRIQSKNVRKTRRHIATTSIDTQEPLKHERNHSSSKILVTGASGQVGQELVPHLRNIYGNDNVIASDIRKIPSSSQNVLSMGGPYLNLDVLDSQKLSQIVEHENIDTIIHLAALLSANGEKNHQLALRLNNGGANNVLDVARNYGLKVFCPSTIGVFGPGTPKYRTPDDTIMRPTTIYGISKVYMELLGDYYHKKFGVDFRSLRYPGVISTKSEAGGGTTDYAVEIFSHAVARRHYTCYLDRHTKLPMIYMPDLLRATSNLVEADDHVLKRRVYNLGAMNFTPLELGECIKRYVPDFRLEFRPDVLRQGIADTWPQSLDCEEAKNDWGWRAEYDLEGMTKDIMDLYLGDDKECVV